MNKILPKSFFKRPALKVARELLGKYLCSGRQCLMITEVEAYIGPEDMASHASRGRTKRNEPMFGEPGIWYVYFTYGIHWMLNVVTGPKDFPAAVLIRGLSADSAQPKNLLNGPAKLTRYLKIDGSFNAKPANKKTGLWIEDRGIKIKKTGIKATPRIGVDYAKEWKNEPFRLLVK